MGLDLKEKRLIRRREKLPAFFRTLGVAAALERSSCDWLRPASLCRGLRRKRSFVPLRRKLTVGGEGRLSQDLEVRGAGAPEQNQALGQEARLP